MNWCEVLSDMIHHLGMESHVMMTYHQKIKTSLNLCEVSIKGDIQLGFSGEIQ